MTLSCLLLTVLSAALSAAVAGPTGTAEARREIAVPAVGLTAPVPTALEPAAREFAAGNYEEARKLALKALEKPESDTQAGQAETLIGHCFYHGLGCDQDMQSAAVFYGKAADRGNAAAQYQLSALHLTGQFPPVSSLEDGYNLLHKSAAAGWPPAQTAVALDLMKQNGPDAPPADPAEAMRLLQAAASGKRFPADPDAQMMLVQMKLAGSGLPGLDAISNEQAYKYASQAAATGRPAAQLLMFNIELNGQLGRKPNPTQAWFWLRTLKFDPMARGMYLAAYRDIAAKYGPPSKELAARIEADAKAFRLKSRGSAPYLPIQEAPSSCGEHCDW